MNRELEENLNNSYLVRRRLATIRKLPGDACYFLLIGDFVIRMYTNAEYSDPPNKELPLVSYERVTVEVWENSESDPKIRSVGYRKQVQLWHDYRFAEYYKELKYTNNEHNWKNGILMPLPVVCDLIKYVDRIVELTAFH